MCKEMYKYKIVYHTDKISTYRNKKSLYFYQINFDSKPMEQHSSLVLNFLASSRKQALAIKPFDINVLLEKYEPLLRKNLGETNKLKMVLGEDLPPVLTDISLFEQIIYSLTSSLNNRISETNRVEFSTKLANIKKSDKSHHVSALPNMSDGDVIISMKESNFHTDHRKQKTPKLSPREMKINKRLEFCMSIVSSMLDQQQGRLVWNLDNDQRNHIEVYLPAAKQLCIENRL